MPDQDQINGGPIPFPKSGVMSPAERELWLLAHKAPEGMMLIHQSEINRIMGTLVHGAKANAANAAMIEAIVLALGKERYESEPTTQDAVASAVFDADRFKKGVDLTLPALRNIRKRIEDLSGTTREMPTTIRIDLVAIAGVIQDRIDLLARICELRRERKQKEAEPTKN